MTSIFLLAYGLGQEALTQLDMAHTDDGKIDSDPSFGVLRGVGEVFAARYAQAIADQLGDLAPVELTQSLEQAVQRAATLAQTGDVALLSPACASLDMFRNYAHRAEVFVAAVRALAEDRGQVWNEGGDHA